MGSFQSSGQRAADRHHCQCAGFNGPAPCIQSVLKFQRCSQAGDNGDGFAGLMETQWGERPGSDYVPPLHLPFCCISRQREGGREGSRVKDGDIVRGRRSVSPIVMQDVLR